MVHVVKVSVEDPKYGKQIRRLAVNSEIVGTFALLSMKIREIFPMLADKQFDLTWRDSENDIIHMSSDGELAQALANAEDGLLRIYVYTPGDPQFAGVNIPQAKSSHNDPHPQVVCDVCDKNIYGYRYKCLQCKNYDLCSACNAADKHGHHDLIKLVKPTHISREWVYLGARKLWRSMFGRCPSAYFKNFQFQKEDATPPPEKPTDKERTWQTVVEDLMKGDTVPAEKLIKENLGNFLHFVDNVAGGVDVRVEGHPHPPFIPRPFHPGHFFMNPKEEKDSPKTAEQPTPAREDVPAAKENVKSAADKQTVQGEENKEEASAMLEPDVKVKDTINPINVECPSEEKVPEPIREPSPPCGLFCEESVVGADGWTLVHDKEQEKKETGVQTSDNNGAKPKVQVIYPDIPETIRSFEAPQEIPNANAASKETSPKVTATTTQNQEIMNALMKMKAMGFTNEGGWLERLLVTKDGNINSALDALYPSARRQ